MAFYFEFDEGVVDGDGELFEVVGGKCAVGGGEEAREDLVYEGDHLGVVVEGHGGDLGYEVLEVPGLLGGGAVQEEEQDLQQGLEETAGGFGKGLTA